MSRHEHSNQPEVADTEEKTSPISGLGKRIAQIACRVGGKKRLAQLSHISESHLYSYISEQSEPTVSRLVTIAHIGDVSICWLATGEENRFRELDTLEVVVARTRSTLSERGITLNPEVEARLLRLLLEICLHHDKPPDEPLLSHIIELVALQT